MVFFLDVLKAVTPIFSGFMIQVARGKRFSRSDRAAVPFVLQDLQHTAFGPYCAALFGPAPEIGKSVRNLTARISI